MRLTLITFLILAGMGMAQRQPSQPASGPGGSNYLYSSTRIGPLNATSDPDDGRYKYYIYQPTPVPATAPVVLVLHGYNFIIPEYYEGWAAHLAQKGYVVVWVQYQTWLTNSLFYDDYAADTFRAALQAMEADQTGKYSKPMRDTNGQILSGVISHSIGGLIATNVAALATDSSNGIPVPRALFLAEPATGLLAPQDYTRIPASTRVMAVVGETDATACTNGVDYLWPRITHIPDVNKTVLVVRNDTYGKPGFLADHTFPTTFPAKFLGAIDARDFYITYKLSTALLNCTLLGSDCEYAAQGSAQQVDTGKWSDGTPIRRMEFFQDPAAIQAPCKTATPRF